MSATPPTDAFPALVKLINRRFMHDPYGDLAKAREAEAATPIENNGMRMWVVGRYADARALLADPDVKKDLVVKSGEILANSVVRPERRPRLPRAIRRNMLDRDEPDHTRLRSLLAKFFTSAKVERMRPRIDQLVTGLLAGIPLGTPVDLIAEFTRPLAVTIIADLLGVPADRRAEFPVWENDILTAPDIPQIERAGVALVEFAESLLEAKRAEPGPDLISGLIEDHRAGALDEPELISMITLMLIGGLEPSSALSNGVFTLLRHPAQLSALTADLGLLSGCINEILRYESPFRMLTPRYSECPMRLGDTTIPADELILVSVAAANRDPRCFDNPDEFDITRDARGHLAFGRGTHRCLGAQLGWLELEIALSHLLSRYAVRLAVPAGDVAWRPGMFMRRLESLPVVLTELA